MKQVLNQIENKYRKCYQNLTRDPNLSLDRVSLNHIKPNSMRYDQFSGLNSDSIKT